MIKLTKEQKERIKELERIEEGHAGEEEYRRSQESENKDFDNEEEIVKPKFKTILSNQEYMEKLSELIKEIRSRG